MFCSRLQLNQSDIVLSSEDLMLVGRGCVNFEPAPPGEEPLAAAADPLDSSAISRLDDDLTSYARSREALQCSGTASTRSRVANLPLSRPTLPPGGDNVEDGDDMQVGIAFHMFI